MSFWCILKYLYEMYCVFILSKCANFAAES